MKSSDAFPSPWIVKDDIPKLMNQTVLIVDDVRMQTVGHGDESEDRPVMYFRTQTALLQQVLRQPNGDPKGLSLNRTNWETCAATYGEDSDAWRGRPVEIFLDAGVMYAGKRVGGVRVRVPNTSATAPASAPGITMTWIELVDYAAKAGIGEDELKEELKRRGLTKLGEAGAVVAEMVQARESAADGYSPTKDDGIPF